MSKIREVFNQNDGILKLIPIANNHPGTPQ